MAETTRRERLKLALSFENHNELCHLEHGFWPETYERWKMEGLPGHVKYPAFFGTTGEEDLFTHFNIFKLGYVRPETYFFPQFPTEVLDETDRYIIEKNGNGVTLKRSKVSISLPLFMDYPIKEKKDYSELRDRLCGSLSDRYPTNWKDWAGKLKCQTHTPVCLHFDGLFAYPREIMGLETMLTTFYDDPEFMHDLINDRVEFYMRVYERAIRDTQPDMAFIWEDMSYKNGPLISPALFENFMLPGYRALTGYLKDMGIRHIIADSDGDVAKLMPLWAKGGVTAVLPFEVRAGMDVTKIGEDFPEIALLGGIDKHEIAKGKDNINHELDRVLPKMKKRGGYVAALDHWVPPDISLDDFRYYSDQIGKY